MHPESLLNLFRAVDAPMAIGLLSWVIDCYHGGSLVRIQRPIVCLRVPLPPSERGEWRVDRRGHKSVGFTSVLENLGSHEEHRIWVVFLMVARGLVAVGGQKWFWFLGECPKRV